MVLLPPRLRHLQGWPNQPSIKLLPESADDQSFEEPFFGANERGRHHVLGLLVFDSGMLFNAIYMALEQTFFIINMRRENSIHTHWRVLKNSVGYKMANPEKASYG